MGVSYTLILTFIITGLAVLLSGCAGSTRYSVYSGYDYPYYGNSVAYRTVYYDDDFDRRRDRIEDERREQRTERVQNASPAQRQRASANVQQKQRQSSQVNRSTRNMGRPRSGGRRR